MKILPTIIILYLTIGMGATQANHILLSDAEYLECRELKDIQWAPSIDDKQRDFAIKSLTAGNYRIVTEAIKAILIHHIATASARLQEVAGDERNAVKKFAQATANILQGPAEKLRPALHGLWERMPKEPYNPNIRDRSDSVEDMIYDALVILEAKALRANPHAQRFIGQAELGWYRANPRKCAFLVALFKFSLLPTDKAIEDLFAAMMQAKGITRKDEIVLLAVLGTYCEPARAKVIDALMSRETLMKATPEGRMLLVEAFKDCLPGLNREEAQRLYAHFSDPKIRDAFFSAPQDLTFMTSLIAKKLRAKALGEETTSAPQNIAVPTKAQPLPHGDKTKGANESAARDSRHGAVKGGGKLTAADLVLPYEQKADGLALIADASIEKYNAYEPWKHQGTKEEKELFAQALKACQDVIDQYPKTDQAARMHFAIHGLYHTRGDDKEARRVLEVISREYAGSPYADSAYVVLGRNEAEAKRYDKAMEYLAKVPPESEYRCSAQIEVVNCLLKKGENEKARQTLAGLSVKYPNRKWELRELFGELVPGDK